MLTPEKLCRGIEETWLASINEDLLECTRRALQERRHGDWDKWNHILYSLPEISPSVVELDNSQILIGSGHDGDTDQREVLRNQLMQLHPWRKGPFNLLGVEIDSEWKSNMKWSRLQHKIDLKGKTILDIGCGNGYYLFRMLGAGAECVLGIDPTQLFLIQFHALKKYYDSYNLNRKLFLLPLKCEELPFEAFEKKKVKFDTVFSMGILYHRKKPKEHIQEVKSSLKRGGELVLETLIIEGNTEDELIPKNRYAKMRNVWSIPTLPKLQKDLSLSGFSKIEVIDISVTTVSEQRSTEWMTFESLSDFLDPDNASKTTEGYPAPNRVLLRCVSY